METPEGTEQEKGQTEEEEFVPLHEATDEELEKAIEGDVELEEDAPEAGTKLPAEDKISPQPEGKAATPETPAPETKETDEKVTDEKYQALLKELEERDKKLAQQEQFIKRRSNELGELRLQLKAFVAEKEKTLNEKFQDNPREALKDEREIAEAQEQLSQIDLEEQQMQQFHVAQRIVAKHLKPDEVDFNGMVDALRADGLDPQVIQNFKANPYAVAQPETIIQLSKRARAENIVKALVPYVKQLKKENEELKAKAKGRPTEILKKVKANLEKAPEITTSAAASSPDTSGVDKPFELMTDTELESYLQRAH